MDLRYEFTGTNSLIAWLRNLPPQAKIRVRDVVTDITEKIRQRVYQKLSGPVLAAKSGFLRDQLQTEVSASNSGATGRVFISGVVYAAIQEYGGRTRPHDILPVKAKALAFMSPAKLGISKSGSSAMVYAKVVHHPGSVMPERSYMRSSLVEYRNEFLERIRGAAAGNA